MPLTQPEKLYSQLVSAVQKFHRDVGQPRAQLDVSGGVDSAVMLGLLAQALGPKNIQAVYSSIYSNEKYRKRAQDAAKAVGVDLIEVDLEEVYELLLTKMAWGLLGARKTTASWTEDAFVMGSIRSTLRAPVGRAINRVMGNGIRHGTGNECEDRWVRFFQKGGDGEVDTNPLSTLSKGEVFQLAHYMNLPRDILYAPPSPDLEGSGMDSDEQLLAKTLAYDPQQDGLHFYSYVHEKTLDYNNVGLIELVNRRCDAYGIEIPRLRDESRASLKTLFPEVADPYALALMVTHVERCTRHKATPRCPIAIAREDMKGVSHEV